MFAKTKMGAAIGLAALLCASVAGAAPTARQTELAHRYMTAVHMDRTMDAMMKAMIPSMLANMPAGDAADEARKKVMTDVMPEIMSDMMAKMTSRMEPIVAETFTEKELADLVAFYEGPTGQAVLDKMPQMAARMAPMMRDLIPDMTQEIVTKVCAKTECSPAQKAMAKPG